MGCLFPEPHPKAEPPKIQRAGVPDCCHVGEATVDAAPTLLSAIAHANDVTPGTAADAERSVHADPGSNERALLARTATIEMAVAAEVVMMSGVGTNCAVAVVENPDCTWLARAIGAALPAGTS